MVCAEIQQRVPVAAPVRPLSLFMPEFTIRHLSAPKKGDNGGSYEKDDEKN